MMMNDWENSLNVILTMNRKNILETKGKVSMELAQQKAKLEYRKYKKMQQHQEKINSLKELEEDIKRLKEKSTQK